MKTLIRQIADGHGGDQQIAVSREFIDSVSTVMYLLGGPGDGSRYTSYVMDSLIAEREFLKEVREQVAQRSDVMLPIEERINRSIAETLKTAGMREEDIPSRRNKSFRRVVRPGPFQVRHRHRERAAPHAEGLRVHDRCRRVTRRDRRPRGSRPSAVSARLAREGESVSTALRASATRAATPALMSAGSVERACSIASSTAVDLAAHSLSTTSTWLEPGLAFATFALPCTLVLKYCSAGWSGSS